MINTIFYIRQQIARKSVYAGEEFVYVHTLSKNVRYAETFSARAQRVAQDWRR